MAGDYVPYGLEPTFKPVPSFAEREPSFGEYIQAEGGNALRASPTSSIYRMTELASANADPVSFGEPGAPPVRLSADDVAARAEKQGVKLDNLGKGQYTEEAANILIDRAVRRQFRNVVVNAYKPSGATALTTGLISSLADPSNIAAAFIPVIGEGRYAELLANAGGLLGRSGIRAAVGAGEGAVGAAAVEPLRVFAETQEGQDYRLADSLRNIAFGTVFGAGLHAGLGAVGDKLFSRRYTTTPPESVPEIIDRLPEEAQQAALSAAISDAIAGKPVDVAPVVDAFIQSGVAKDVSFASTLRRDGPPLDDLVSRTAYWEQELASLKSPPKNPVPFLTWLKQQGGLRDVDNDIKDYVGDTAHLGKGYISQKGATRTERGLTFDDLFERVKAEGYVTTRQELRDAFMAGNEVTKPTERDAIKAHQDKAAYIQKLLDESGVNPKTRTQIKARAIAGRERHIYAAEQARLATATDRLNARGDDYRNVSEPQPVKPYEYEKAGGEDTGIQVGDTVFTLDEKGLPNEGAPRKVASIVDDPLRGRHVMFESDIPGQQVGYPANQLQIHQRAPRIAEPTAITTPKETPKPDEITGKYTFEQFAAELKDAFDTARGPVSFSAMKERLPGISNSLIEAYSKKLIDSQDVGGVARGTEKGERYIGKRKHLTLNELAAQTDRYNIKIEQARRNLDKLYPNMGAQRTYYLSAIMRQADVLQMGLRETQRFLNKEIEEGRLKAFSEDEAPSAPATEAGNRATVAQYLAKYPDREGIKPSEKITEFFANSGLGEEVTFKGEPFKVKATEDKITFSQTDKGGKQGAHFIIEPHPQKDNALNISDAWLPESMRQKGIGTSVYDYVQQLAAKYGLDVLPVDAQKGLTEQGAAFWAKRVGEGPKALDKLPPDSFTMNHRLDQPDIRLVFSEQTPVKAEPSRPKSLFPENPNEPKTASEARARQMAEQRAEVPAQMPRVETPPAERNELTATELQKSTEEYQKLQEATLRKYEAIAKDLLPETAALLRQSLDKINSDADELSRILESATQCMVKVTV